MDLLRGRGIIAFPLREFRLDTNLESYHAANPGQNCRPLRRHNVLNRGRSVLEHIDDIDQVGPNAPTTGVAGQQKHLPVAMESFCPVASTVVRGNCVLAMFSNYPEMRMYR